MILLASLAASLATPVANARLGASTALAEWRQAPNRAACAPLALTGSGGIRNVRVRRADFSSGWGVAFDTAARRSAFGFAGTGLLPDEPTTTHAERRAALVRQWPYLRELGRRGGLPAGSFAGYGLEGAAPYSRRNPQGRGQHSFAYVRIPGQDCLYNVWSRVSRRHLEQVLDNLRLLPTPSPASLPPLPSRP